MHTTNDQGELVFTCDFCHQPWAENRAMVEGHRGALICENCLSIAYTEVIHLKMESPIDKDEMCVLCRENGRDDPHWRSPMFEDAISCRRCLKQSAGVLNKDPDIPWQRPRDPSEDETTQPG